MSTDIEISLRRPAFRTELAGPSPGLSL